MGNRPVYSLPIVWGSRWSNYTPFPFFLSFLSIYLQYLSPKKVSTDDKCRCQRTFSPLLYRTRSRALSPNPRCVMEPSHPFGTVSGAEAQRRMSYDRHVEVAMLRLYAWVDCIQYAGGASML